jgi:hypothetical protein
LTNVTVEKRWKEAVDKAENQRAANIARNVTTQKAKEGLAEAADKATAKAVEEVTREMRIYVIVDKSGSMQQALEQAKEYMTKFVGAFPLEKLHVSVFNTVGREVAIKAPTAAAVKQAFLGHRAGGGTNYAAGAHCLLSQYKTSPDEDALLVFVGDQAQARGAPALQRVIEESGVNVAAFGMLHIRGMYGDGTVVEETAARLGVPCFKIEEGIFEDPYAVPRTLRNLIASTPVGKRVGPPAVTRRVSLVDAILKTPLLRKPNWA